jgi:uncharacterized protein YndB with AHSA1/START domain
MDNINKSIFFAASRETVWSFLTDKDKLGLWFHPAEANLAEGQDYSLISTADDGTINKQCWGTVLEMDAPAHLKHTFTIKPLGGALTNVTWTLEEINGGTKLSLTHEGISAAAGEAAMGLLLALDAGWDKHLGSLRDAV